MQQRWRKRCGGGGDNDTTTSNNIVKDNNAPASFLSDLDKLPSEQDRKATLGCLAAVLNIMFAYQHQYNQNDQHKTLDNDNNNDDDDSNRGGASNDRNIDSEGEETIIAFSIRSNQDEHNSRTREFQTGLLFLSSELLFLDPETHARAYLPTLDIQCWDNSDHNHVNNDNRIQ